MKRFLLAAVLFFMFFSGIHNTYAKECMIGNLVIELSQDYPKPSVTRYGTSSKLIVGSVLRENQTQAFISVEEIYVNKMPEKNKERLQRLDPEKELGPFLAKKKIIYKDFQTLSVSKCKINGLKFTKITWSGYQPKVTTMMKGIYLVAINNDVIYELNYVDFEDYFDLCAPEAMKIFESISR